MNTPRIEGNQLIIEDEISAQGGEISLEIESDPTDLEAVENEFEEASRFPGSGAEGEDETREIYRRAAKATRELQRQERMATFEIAERVLSRAGHAEADPHGYLVDQQDGAHEDLGLPEEVEDEAFVLASKLIKLIEENVSR